MISGLNPIPGRTITNSQQFRAALQDDVSALSRRFDAEWSQDPGQPALMTLLTRQREFAALHGKVTSYTATPAEYQQSAELKKQVEAARNALVPGPNVKLHDGEVSLSWTHRRLPSFLQDSGFQSIRYCISREVAGQGPQTFSGPIRLSALAEGPGGKSLLVTVALRPDGDRPYLDQSLQAERGVGSKHMLMDGEFKRFNSNPDLSTLANLQRLSPASLAMTAEILKEVNLSWNIAH